MVIFADILVLLIVLQTTLKLSLWRQWWLTAIFAAAVGLVVWLSVDELTLLSKPQVTGWLHSVTTLQNIVVVCLIDASLHRLRWYPGLLIIPAMLYVLVRLLFIMTGTGFHTTAFLLAVAIVLLLPLTERFICWLLPKASDRVTLTFLITIAICLFCLIATQQTVIVYQTTNQNIIMEYISKALFGIANILLIPDILMLIFFFFRSLVLLITTYKQYAMRRLDGFGPLYAKYRQMLYAREPDEAYVDYLISQLETEAAKDVNLSRLLTKIGPVLGLIGTLISMSPALVGLSTGDISGMAYNMQVVFSATVVGLVISLVGLFTQQLKSRWYAMDVARLEYVSRNYVERHETEA